MVVGTVGRNGAAAAAAAIDDDLVRLAYGIVGTPAEARDELDRINEHLGAFYKLEPDLAIRGIIAYSPRVTEMIRWLFRLEGRDRQYARIRTMDAEPLLSELDRQFKAHSRLLEARGQDLAIEGIRR